MTYQNEKKDEKIKSLEKEIVSLKNIIDSKEAQITTYKSVNEDHRKLNGSLRKEIDDLKLANVQAVEDAKKEADKLMIEKIKKYEKKNKTIKTRCKGFIKLSMSDLKDKIRVWSLYYRTEIIWFVIGFIIGAILL